MPWVGGSVTEAVRCERGGVGVRSQLEPKNEHSHQMSCPRTRSWTDQTTPPLPASESSRTSPAPQIQGPSDPASGQAKKPLDSIDLTTLEALAENLCVPIGVRSMIAHYARECTNET